MTEAAQTLEDFEQSIENWYNEDQYKHTDEEYQMLVDSVNVPENNKVFEATIKGEDNTHFLLDCNFKDLVRVPKTREENNFFSQKSVGDKINVLIINITDKGNYSINGSVASIYREEAFSVLRGIEDNEYVEVVVDKLTPAGYDCRILMDGCEIEAFLPQILAGVNKIHDDAKDDLTGNTYNMCVESYANDKGTWIVSRRKYLKQLIPQYIDELSKEMLYTGHVTGTTKFGVFVEFFECLTGMIHKTNLTEEWAQRFDNIQPGEEITFYVKEILEGRNNKLILSQVISESIWDTIEVGQKLTGKIKEHKPFGTLVSLDHETLGLIHTSQQTPKIESMEKGEEIKVRVLAVDRSKRKIFLAKK
jgi:ribosomal protein S1